YTLPGNTRCRGRRCQGTRSARLKRRRPPLVYLSRIYTKSGDAGETGLGDGSRVAKDHARVAAYGGVDELNAVLGLLLADQPMLTEAELLRSVQNDLYDVGPDLCCPFSADEPPCQCPPGRSESTTR